MPDHPFDDWFHETVGYTLRSEWFYAEFPHISINKIMDCMRAAYAAGYERAQDERAQDEAGESL